jgi:hypothetical protein
MSTAARDALATTSNCPADQVKVEELGDSKYRASGCQKTETYICKAAERRGVLRARVVGHAASGPAALRRAVN